MSETQPDRSREPLEERLRRLEDVAFEGQSLTRAVTRLGLNADALSDALQTVDRNQQRLTALGDQLERVEAEKADSTVVDAQVHAEARVRRMAVGFIVFAVVLVVVMLLGLTSQAYDACTRRQAATQVNIGVLSDLIDVNSAAAPDDPRLAQQAVALQRAIDELNETLDVTCEQQYPLARFWV